MDKSLEVTLSESPEERIAMVLIDLAEVNAIDVGIDNWGT